MTAAEPPELPFKPGDRVQITGVVLDSISYRPRADGSFTVSIRLADQPFGCGHFMIYDLSAVTVVPPVAAMTAAGESAQEATEAFRSLAASMDRAADASERFS